MGSRCSGVSMVPDPVQYSSFISEEGLLCALVPLSAVGIKNFPAT